MTMLRSYLPGQCEFEESTIPHATKIRYKKLVRSRKGKCLWCLGKLDRFGVICKSCFGMVELPWIEREAMRAIEQVRQRELNDL